MLEKTPYEILNGRKLNMAYFRVFGCKCYILKKGTRLSSLRRNVMKASYLVTPLLARLIECAMKRFMMWNLMKPMVSKRKMRI
jgi:hypothetical protein